jgi:chromosome segregation ATPase
LYQSEQALEAGLKTIPQSKVNVKDQLKKLEKEHDELVKKLDKEVKDVKKLVHSKHKVDLEKASQLQSKIQEQLTELNKVNSQIAELKKAVATAIEVGPYNGGLAQLKSSILKLQESVLYYTKLLIAVEAKVSQQSGSTSTTGTTGTTGSTGSTGNTGTNNTGTTNTGSNNTGTNNTGNGSNTDASGTH